MKRLLASFIGLCFFASLGWAQSSSPALLIGFAKGISLNGTNVDAATITVSAPKYYIDHIDVTNASTSFGASLATLGVYTGAGATGTTVVTLATLTALTAASKMTRPTLALTTDSLTAATLYIRNGVTFGSAATVDVYVYGDVLP